MTTAETTGTTAEQKQALGKYGEKVAERHLCEIGMEVLERNWRCDAGEIDLVLRHHDTLVICEVKTRSGDEFGTPHEAVDDAKLDRLRRLAERWRVEHDLTRVPDVRIDVVAVTRPRRGAAQVDHVKGL